MGVLINAVALWVLITQANTFEGFEYHVICTVLTSLSLLGMVFIISIFNFNNKVVNPISILTIGFVLGCIMFNEYVRTWAIYVIVLIVIKVTQVMFKNSISTILTALLLMIPTIATALILLRTSISISVGCLYALALLYFITYIIFGVKLNQRVLKHLFGCSEGVYILYNKEQLKVQFNVMYVIFFIGINITGLCYTGNQIAITLLNNVFITGISIVNIDWKHVRG